MRPLTVLLDDGARKARVRRQNPGGPCRRFPACGRRRLTAPASRQAIANGGPPQQHVAREPAQWRELTIERVGAQGDGVAAGPVFAPLDAAGRAGARRGVRRAGRAARGARRQLRTGSRRRVRTSATAAAARCSTGRSAPYLAWKAEQIRAGPGPRADRDRDPARRSPRRPGSRRRLALHARRGPGGLAGSASRRGARGGWRRSRSARSPIRGWWRPSRRCAGSPRRCSSIRSPRRPCMSTLTETGLDVDITGVERRSGGLSADARARVAERGRRGRLRPRHPGRRDPLPGPRADGPHRPRQRRAAAGRLPAGGAGGGSGDGRLRRRGAGRRQGASPTSTAASAPSRCGWPRTPPSPPTTSPRPPLPRCERRTARRPG